MYNCVAGIVCGYAFDGFFVSQPVIDKRLDRMSEHEKATFRPEDCDGIGLNYDFGCKQIDNYGYNDDRKNRFPKKTKPPRVEEKPD